MKHSTFDAEKPIVVSAELFIPNSRCRCNKPFNKYDWALPVIQDAKLLDDIDIEVMIKERLAHQLADEIVKRGLFDIQKMQGRPMFDETHYRAVVAVLPPMNITNENSLKGNNTMVSFDICEGNMGALTFLMRAYDIDMGGAEMAFRRMQNNNIKGAKLYMLWNDCCDRNTKMALEIMKNNSIEDIVEHINYENGRGIPYPTE